MSKIPIWTKNNSTMAIIITIKEKNTLAIADMITILQRKIILLTSKISNKTSINFKNMNFSPSDLYSQPGKLWMDRGTA